MENENVMDLALQLVQVEMDLKTLESEMGLVEPHRRSEFHSRLWALVDRQGTIADALEAFVARSDTAIEAPGTADVGLESAHAAGFSHVSQTTD